MIEGAKNVTVKELLHNLNLGSLYNETVKQPAPGGDAENFQFAAEALAHIFVLKEHPEFLWFAAECLEKTYAEAREKFTGVNIPAADLPVNQKLFHQAQTIRFWLLDREITYRKVINRADPHIKNLEAELDRLKK